ncbi:hypothetical protein [Arcobacter porcinus]|uniref:Putative membrane protein n=1 Tax=Arcobacter porcinus TaxID=1935204 RepID=A0A5C2HEK1_9BACT|nr:hypothetical protein [Arcobacter porcinus]OCL90657.1 hypothetical protein AAX27_01466 [Aliarcobacter thereius]QEP40815.1 putative membrane protein [Arcobacter porcinus]
MKLYCLNCSSLVTDISSENCPNCERTCFKSGNEPIEVKTPDAIVFPSKIFDKDPVTKNYVSRGFLERLLEKFPQAFGISIFSLILFPMFLLIYEFIENKFVHNNIFWIKKLILYFIFLFFYINIVYMLSTGGLIGIVFILLLGLLAMSFVIHIGVYLFPKDMNKKLSETEIDKVIEIQRIDNNVKNIKTKKIYIITGIILGIVYYWNFYLEGSFRGWDYLNVIPCILVFIFIADIVLQKKLKRDLLPYFWTKRILLYAFLFAPFLPYLYLFYY